MQKIFIIKDTHTEKNESGNFGEINAFIGKTGKILTVTAQNVAGSKEQAYRGRFLIVADDGKYISL